MKSKFTDKHKVVMWKPGNFWRSGKRYTMYASSRSEVLTIGARAYRDGYNTTTYEKRGNRWVSTGTVKC